MSDATNKTKPAPGDARLHTLLLTEARKLFLVSCPPTSSLIRQAAANDLHQCMSGPTLYNHATISNCPETEKKRKKKNLFLTEIDRRNLRKWGGRQDREGLEMAEPASKIEAPSSRFPIFCSAAPSPFDI